jgi:GrpB-like predicted nucleotidyltransferase (UPF0157 family)
MIEIVPYDPGWAARFVAEAACIREAMGSLALRIDHVGSTSVPGLAAKPVIDIQVSVASLGTLGIYADTLAKLGYSHIPLDPGDSIIHSSKASHVAQHVPHPFVRPWLGARKPAYCFS